MSWLERTELFGEAGIQNPQSKIKNWVDPAPRAGAGGSSHKIVVGGKMQDRRGMTVEIFRRQQARAGSRTELAFGMGAVSLFAM